LQLDPSIAQKVEKVVLMGGCIYKTKLEYNIEKAKTEAQKVFSVEWKIIMAPLDCTQKLFLNEDRFARVQSSTKKLAQALMENNQKWASGSMQARYLKANPSDKDMVRSSLLHDSLAIYLAVHEQWTIMESLQITVDSKGMTIISEKEGKFVLVATSYSNLDALLDYLTEKFIAS